MLNRFLKIIIPTPYLTFFPGIKNRGGNKSGYLKKNTFQTFILHGVAIGLSFIISLVMARIMGASGYGTYTYVFSWITVLGTFGTLGFNQLTVRETARLKTSGKSPHINALFRFVSGKAFIAALLLGLLSAGVLYLFNIPANPALRSTLYLGLPAIPLISLLTIKRASMEGLKHPVPGQIPEKLIRPFLFLASLIFIYFLNDRKLLPGTAVISDVAVHLIALLSAVFLLKKYVPASPDKTFPKNEQHLFLKSAFIFLLIEGVSTLDTQIDILMLGFMKMPEDIGIYNISKRLSSLIALILFVFNIVLAPVIASLYEEGKIAQLQKIITKGIRSVFVIASFITVLLIFTAPFLLGLFGKTFINGKNTLILLSVSQLLNIAAGSVAYLLSMTGHEKDTLWGFSAGLLINISLNIVLIPLYGILGAALANLITVFCWNMIMLYLVRKRIGIYASILGKISP